MSGSADLDGSPRWLRGHAPTALVKPTIFLLACLPLLALAQIFVDPVLRANPWPEVVRQSGLWGLRFLLLTLLLSPLRLLTGWRAPMRLRRMLGLFAAFYAGVHILAWMRDYDFLWPLIGGELLRSYLLVGLVAGLILLAQALTSSRAAIRRLGARRWRRLHWLVHPAAIAVIAHYVMDRRFDRFELAAYAALLMIAFAVRLAARPGYPYLGPMRRRLAAGSG